MRKILLLVLALLILSGQQMAMAQGEPSKLKSTLAMPWGACGVICGALVGVPIKIGRDVVHETNRMNDTLRDDFDCVHGSALSQIRLVTYCMAVPYGLASGSILGAIHGLGDAVKFGYAKPFSRQSFGLAGETSDIAMKVLP